MAGTQGVDGSRGRAPLTRGLKRTDIPLSLGMLLVTVGVVYGDIGTSPLYVMKAIVEGNGGLTTVNEDFILGALSLIIWTLTLITTIKYVVVAMRADNHHEGGIFALYSLIRRCGRWLILPAMIGGAALLADGILTPAVTVTTAIEGLRTVSFGAALIGDSQARVVFITVAILCLLFVFQRAGTSSIGKTFGSMMVVWFLFLGLMGVFNFVLRPDVIRACNPVYGINFLFSGQNHAGLMVLGFVFLATTGAEALYSDMGHVGRANIYVSWPFVKICLVLNYLGQGAWLLAHAHNSALQTIPDLNPFFQMVPVEMRTFAIILSTIAAIIASQALITGSYTLVSEATRLNLMPHLHVHYPSATKGQIYIPLVNNVMWVGCVGVVLLFQTSHNMEAAYGLSITITMLMTTFLLTVYLAHVKRSTFFAVLFTAVFLVIESIFFLSSLTKFTHGGYVTVIIASLIFMIMFIWRKGTAVERSQSSFLPVDKYVGQLFRLSQDEAYPLLADNLVFLTNDGSLDQLDRDILYSILDKHPKRAKAYWFLNVTVTDEPFTHSYVVNNFGTDFIFKVQFQLGFKVNQRINTYLHQVVSDLTSTGEMKPQKHEYSIYRHPGLVGDFRFCMLRKMIAPETDVSTIDYVVMTAKYAIRRLCGSAAQWYGLENSSIVFEYVPLFGRSRVATRLDRLSLDGVVSALHEAEDDDIFSQSMAARRAENDRKFAKDVIGGDTGVVRSLLSYLAKSDDAAAADEATIAAADEATTVAAAGEAIAAAAVDEATIAAADEAIAAAGEATTAAADKTTGMDGVAEAIRVDRAVEVNKTVVVAGMAEATRANGVAEVNETVVIASTAVVNNAAGANETAEATDAGEPAEQSTSAFLSKGATTLSGDSIKDSKKGSA